MKRRRLTSKDRLSLFEREDGVCHLCGGKVQIGQAWEASHEIPLALGGEDGGSNLRVAHAKCHRTHTSVVDIPTIAKSNRVRLKHAGISKASRMPGSRASGWKRKLDGTVVRRHDET